MAAFGALALLISQTACSSEPTLDDFRGTAFRDARMAQDFELTDQFGDSKSLRRDYSGKVVVLTFLYTECPDVCPIVANHLRDISEALDGDAAETAIVIVSVDPDGDTVESVQDYSERWQMMDRWSFLVGSEAELEEVWEAYYIDPYVHGPGSLESEDTASAVSQVAGGGGVDALVEQTGRVIHSAPIYIIDADGRMRSAFTLPLETDDVLSDVRLVGG